ncbi:hypothetical protein SmJEL517_g00712 [Synchytrium microbalum]|uniref:protein-tyrosine-phosphatase n=1 Tax=Synchytrium microbalum TaxID=1806994 RepID=A0A507CIZ6_9FUNG|nr:uncharacterized protein SmJEL517_g00712 [Synchytrium microbalum]TPX37673.1 hypothetical protein SmJEL517_g00712 [Synchytrium microbalum]
MTSMVRGHSKEASNTQMMRLPNLPSLIEFGKMRFLIFDAPSPVTLPTYAAEMEKNNVVDVVRVCEPTYDRAELEKRGIKVHDLPFADGDPPPSTVVNSWLDLVQERFITNKDKANGVAADSPGPCIGVHCVAGLGRAPVLVAMALIEAGMNPLDSVIFIRERRKGAINARQLKYIEGYKRRSKEKSCIIC